MRAAQGIFIIAVFFAVCGCQEGGAPDVQALAGVEPDTETLFAVLTAGLQHPQFKASYAVLAQSSLAEFASGSMMALPDAAVEFNGKVFANLKREFTSDKQIPASLEFIDHKFDSIAGFMRRLGVPSVPVTKADVNLYLQLATRSLENKLTGASLDMATITPDMVLTHLRVEVALTVAEALEASGGSLSLDAESSGLALCGHHPRWGDNPHSGHHGGKVGTANLISRSQQYGSGWHHSGKDEGDNGPSRGSGHNTWDGGEGRTNDGGAWQGGGVPSGWPNNGNGGAGVFGFGGSASPYQRSFGGRCSPGWFGIMQC